MFDPQAFMETAIEGDFNSERIPFPEVASCFATIERAEAAGGEKDGRPWRAFNITFKSEDDPIKKAGLNSARVRYSFFLNVTGDGAGGVRFVTREEDANANVDFQRLKDALGIKRGKPVSGASLVGLGCYIKTRHRPNPNDVDAPPFCDVIKVSRDPIPSR